MRQERLEGAFWPTERQKLLLRTAFAGGERSAEAWGRLRPQLDLDRLDLGSFAVLPLVHRQLTALAIEDADLPRLAGIRRRTWYLNQLQLDSVAAALRALEGVGADPIVVGGWQLPVRYYDGDFGLRPVEGLEVLVRPAQIDDCVRALGAVGFAGARGAGRSVHLATTEGRRCTLHERLAPEFSDPDRGLELDDIWDATTPVSLAATHAHVLDPSDELVRTCLVGARVTVTPSVLWVADALAVLSATDALVEWERVVRQARRLRAVLRLRDALVYIRRELAAPVPEEAIRELEATAVRPRERLAHKEAGRDRRVIGLTPRAATRFLHVTADLPLPLALARLPTFLRDELGLERRLQIPLEVARRAARRFRQQPD